MGCVEDWVGEMEGLKGQSLILQINRCLYSSAY